MAGDGDKKKNDPTVPIIIGIGALLLVLLFGGCGQISLPTINTGSGYSSPNPTNCDSRRSDCRGHYDGNGRWIPDDNARRDEHHRSDHQRKKPRSTDDSDRSGDH